MRRREHGISKPGEPKRMRAKGLTCSVEGCDGACFARGMCRRHYRRAALGLPVEDVDDGQIVGVSRSGKSVWGVVEQDGDRLICHECGRSYINLSVHIAMAHDMSVRDYRLAHGLTMRQRLVSEPLQERKREIGMTVAHNLVDVRTPDTLRLADQRIITRGRRLRNAQDESDAKNDTTG